MDLSKQNISNVPQTNQEQMKTAMEGRAQMQSNEEWNCECGIKNDGKFCVNCGKSKVEQNDKKQCPKCKNMNEKNDKFCGECGTKLD